MDRPGLIGGVLGRQGQGPEEFENLWSVHVRGADTLVVADYRPWRWESRGREVAPTDAEVWRRQRRDDSTSGGRRWARPLRLRSPH